MSLRLQYYVFSCVVLLIIPTVLTADRTVDLEITGSIQSIDIKKKQIEIMQGTKRIKFYFENHSQVFLNAKKVNLSDLKEGDVVKIIYWHDPETNRKYIISSLEVKRGVEQ